MPLAHAASLDMIEELHHVERPPRASSNSGASSTTGRTANLDADANNSDSDEHSIGSATGGSRSRRPGAEETADQHQQPHYADADIPNAFDSARHGGRHNLPAGQFGQQGALALTFKPARPWRIRDRMKTVSVAMVVCLNVGVDPPDVFKITPCARLECWIDPSAVSSQKAMEMIGINLQKQYEQWQPRARFKQALDPTNEDVKKLCTSLRRSSKEERVLFHYNGHGVPRPTVNGEIWVFNRTYTQYIPLSIYDLQQWIGAPSIFVYDCSNAGVIVNLFNQFAEQHERELEQQQKDQQAAAAAAAPTPTGCVPGTPQPAPAATPAAAPAAAAASTPASFKNCIQMAACAADQILPMNAAVPADLFTSCLTTPIKMALKWFTLKQTAAMVPHVPYALIERIPGVLNDRRTMMGELNWIFIAVTDTIAWNMLPRDTFQQLFRQDLLVASMFRNFLLADRIMRAYDCTPVSHPPLPASCHRHPMWASWDLALDLAVKQLPGMFNEGLPYESSPFFRDQLSAFGVWLEQGCEERNPPEQLPIVLQVLLSQMHRVRALELLGRFLDLGPWAVHMALSLGIFPYVLKLLQASGRELRPLLVFIWAKILAFDQTCQVDLICDQGHKYFLSVLQDAAMTAEHRTAAAFVLAQIVHGFPLGQSNALQGSLVAICLEQLGDAAPRLRQWLAICLGNLWQSYDKARWSGVRDLAHDKLYPLLLDEVPEVRAAAVYALGTFISSVTAAKDRTEHANNIDRSIAMELLARVGNDMSPMVRMELIAAFQWMIILFENQFVSAFMQEPTAIGPAAAAQLPTAFRAMTLAQQQHQQHQPPTPSGSSSSMWSPAFGGGAGSCNTNSLERNLNMKRVSSSSSIAAMQHFPSTTIIGFGSTYMKLWQALCVLARDPHPAVAALAQRAIDFVVNQVVALISAKEAAARDALNSSLGSAAMAAAACGSSMSLPPSPNTRGHYLGGDRGPGVAESPPTHQPHINTHLHTPSPGAKMFASANGGSSSRRATPMSASAAHRSRKNSRHAATDVESDADTADKAALKQQQQQKPIVTTDFIPWCVAQFSTPSTSRPSETTTTPTKTRPAGSCAGGGGDVVDSGSSSIAADLRTHATDTTDAASDSVDHHDPAHLRRMARFRRNEATRHLAREQKCRAIFHRLETQSWSSRTQNVARVVRLHPFELQIAVAYKNKISVNDWTRNSIHVYQPTSATAQTQTTASASSSKTHSPVAGGGGGANSLHSDSPVCTVDFINAHDRTLIMAGYEDGGVRLWRPPTTDDGGGPAEPHLITAWQAINDIQAGGGQRYQQRTGLVLTWQQPTQTVVCGGDTKQLRCWDARTERKLCDIATGSDAAVAALSSGGSLVAAGFRDGSVRLYDRRAGGTEGAKVRTFRETSGVIVAACLRDDADHLVVGCAQRSVRLYDIRHSAGSMSFWRTDGELQHMDVHRSADILACGNGTAGISVYGLDGRLLSAIRSHGFMQKQGVDSVACLAFHPLKVCLAAGFQDQTVAVYVTDSKRYAM